MTTSTLVDISRGFADIVSAAAPSVVQVRGRRRPASGLVFSDTAVVTTARALGREDGLQICMQDGRTVDAEFAGWDPATELAVLRVTDLPAAAAARVDAPARVGELTLALARSWSNVITASAGIVAVVGGPLRTGRHRSIEQVIRTTAPMHDGFAGGPVLDANGHVLGISTAVAIRGFTVVIPSAIAWKAAADILEHGGPRRAFLGVAGQAIELPSRQRELVQRDRALLVAGVTTGSPADAAGLLVGDIITDVDGRAIESAEDLLEILHEQLAGKTVALRIIRGGALQELTVAIGQRPRPS